MAIAITVPDRRLNRSLLRIRTGRRPACSLPRTGSRPAQYISHLRILATPDLRGPLRPSAALPGGRASAIRPQAGFVSRARTTGRQRLPGRGCDLDTVLHEPGIKVLHGLVVECHSDFSHHAVSMTIHPTRM